MATTAQELKEKFGTATSFRCKMYIQTYSEYLKMEKIPCADCGCMMVWNGWIDKEDLIPEEPSW